MEILVNKKRVCGLEEFKKAQDKGYGGVVLVDITGELIAPSQVLWNLRGERYPFLMESALIHPKVGAMTVAGCQPFLTFLCKDGGCRIVYEDGRGVEEEGNPLDILGKLLEGFKIEKPEWVSFAGGAVGFFGYDVKNYIEELPAQAVDDLKLPDCLFGFYDAGVLQDTISGKTWVFGVGFAWEKDTMGCARERAEKFFDKFCTPSKWGGEVVAPKEVMQRGREGNLEGLKFCTLSSTHSREKYVKMIKRAKEYIAAGDIYQANLSQRIEAEFKGDSICLYEVLKLINPSPFACFFDVGDFTIVSSSPERLVRVRGRIVETRPIAGTKPRGRDEYEEACFERELALSPKERAEHVMILDMARNDIGRVCRYGTVYPDEIMVHEKYSHVIHIVSNVRGILRDEVSNVDVVKAVFPAASITGVPKVRCMEIIDELEPVRRGIYTGSFGWLGFCGNMDLNILIRTILLKASKAYLQVGGGVVADSDPHAEYEETIHKAKALINAIASFAESMHGRR